MSHLIPMLEEEISGRRKQGREKGTGISGLILWMKQELKVNGYY